MRVVDAAQMRIFDRRAIDELGIPAAELMEQAGAAVARAILSRPQRARDPVRVVCGPGNNGGDGYVAARHLRAAGREVAVLTLAAPEQIRGEARTHWERLQAAGAAIEVVPDQEAWNRLRPLWSGANTVLDALFGTGLSRALEGLPAQVVSDLADLPAYRVAIDIPSGLSADSGELLGPSFFADLTVALALPKRAHVLTPAAERVGELLVVDIGIPAAILADAPPADLELLTAAELSRRLPKRERGAHKGRFGRVLMVAGGPGKVGAAELAARAAARSGAGLVTVATSASVQRALESRQLEWMSLALPETSSRTLAAPAGPALLELAPSFDVVAAGPGLGRDDETRQALLHLVRGCPRPLVLDADALNVHADAGVAPTGSAERPVVLTPHPGEFARLLGSSAAEIQAHRLEAARGYAQRHFVHVVLKGYRTLIAAPDGRAWVSPTGNPGMATGGSGDVLTGVLAGLIGQLPLLDALALGVFCHGLAGDLAAERAGELSLIASDLLEALPAAFASLQGGPAS